MKAQKGGEIMPDLQKCVVCDVLRAITVFSPKGRVQEMNDRACYGISFCLSGQITYIQNGKKFVSDREHAVILPQGGTYQIYGTETGDFPVVNFTCRDFLCNEITTIKIRNYDQLIHDFEQLRKAYSANAGRPKLLSIFYHMLDLLHTEGYPGVLQTAARYLEAHCSDMGLCNKDVACVCKISEVYLRKLFAQYFHTSPKQYLIDLRIKKAKQLLLQGNMKTSDLSEQCGFANAYHFCRLFKKHTGLTPTEYRLENQIWNL